jgi:aryl-alcohol dehydrogenase-like predicted oxidoreductase
MRAVKIPTTEIAVSILALGAGPFGTRTSREDSFRILDAYLEAGGNFLDTAHIYAAWVPGGGGVSERTIGEWLRANNTRDRVVIGTKGGHFHLNTPHQARLAPEQIEQDLAESLERLGVETVDLYWLHRDDPQRPVGEMIDTLNRAIAQGKIGCYGLSNWSVPRMREALAYATAHSVAAPLANQPGWSLAERRSYPTDDPTMHFMDGEMLTFHRETGLLAAGYSSQANGFFAGTYGRDILPPTPGVNQGVVRSYYSDANFDRLDRARELAARHHTDPNAIALAYLTNQPFPSSAILGCGTLEHLRHSLTAADLVLTPEEVNWLFKG